MKAQIKALKQTKKKRLSIKQQILKEAKKRGEITEYTAKALTGAKRATVIARISELLNEGKLKIVKTFNDGKNSIFSFVECSRERKKLSNKRENERFEKWKKLGEKNNYFKLIKNE